jgi:phenylalanyl-tRNA synthetase beta chain
VDDDYPAQDAVDEVQSIAESIAGDIFTAIEISVFDVYRGENVAAGKKSLGLNLLFRNERKTPSDGEIDGVFQQLVSTLRQHPRFQLRG